MGYTCVDKAEIVDFDQSDAAFKRAPRLSPALLEQQIETIPDRSDAYAEMSDKFGDYRYRDNVPRREARGMPFV
ncbi:hypothetical protein OEG84_24395 [Hoeflea sp. G2-23]|uniref:Uncharacterized protein n=1 Tax=Hoeflea algicola TaxID=2983763 RepID=A0ABT3ZG14_9HYPH|nr:hypothetical protein [Hoeflea algicola]MCY0150750.1 hypothetical protein [Hoeflea algicola]